MKIPFVDLNKTNKQYYSKFLKSFSYCLKNSQFIKDKFNVQLEKKIKSLFKVKECLLVNSGTDALIVGIKSLSLKPGDEVIVTSNTWISSAYAIVINNLKPVFVDIDQNNFQMNIQDFKKKINKKTKAVIITHLYGFPNDMDKIIKICNKDNIHIIEDVAQAHLAKYKKKYVGNFGTFSILSFYPSKNLGALGDGGAIITNSKKIYKKCSMLANYGSLNFKDKDHKVVGYNSRMDEIQASFLLSKITNLKKDNNKRKKLAKIYHKYCDQLKIKSIEIKRGFENVYHIFPILVNNRNSILKKLKEKKIFAQIHYEIPIHLQSSFKFLGYRKNSLPVTEKVSKKLISLPFYPGINKKEIKYIFFQLGKSLKSKIKK